MSLLTPALAPQEAVHNNVPAKTNPPYRRTTDTLIMRRMARTCILFAILNLFFALLVFNPFGLTSLDILMSDFLDQQKERMGFVFFLSLFLTFMIYHSLQSRRFLEDVQRIAHERDKERDMNVQHQKMESLGDISAGISHEINTCLQSILNCCEMARNRLEHKEDLALYLNKAIRNSLHARKVIDSVLAFAQEGAALESDDSPLAELTDEAISYSRAFLPGSISVDCIHRDSNLRVYVDSSAYLQIMNNLVANAAFAMDYKGVIVIETSRFQFADRGETKGLRHNRTYVKVEVTDTGHGIPPENLGKIFDPFFTTKKSANGTGLGLSIVYGMVRNMGGSIDVKSKVGKGTTFTILLPNTKEEETHETA